MTRRFTLALALFSATLLSAQCPTCTPDESCASPDGLPAVCPEIIPSAIAGEPFEEVLTFFLPASVEDPDTGIPADLIEVTVTGLTGLPFGLDYALDQADATYSPQSGENYGCATICGTPIVPGVFTATVFVDVTVSVLGFDVETSESFERIIEVLPGSGSNASFTFSNLTGCGSTEVQFEALVDGAPQPTTWNWDFGNGETSDQEIPELQTYDTPGSYEVTLETQVLVHQLNEVNITALADNWAGDIDELSAALFNPDPYFVVADGSGSNVYTSSEVSDQITASWSGIGLQLPNPPYTITFWDSDTFTDDDQLGSAPLLLEDGLQNLTAGGGGTTAIASIGLEIQTQLNDTVFVEVFPLPSPDYILGDDGESMAFNDPEITGFIWTLNGDTLTGAADSVLVFQEGQWGVYQAFLTNIYGCEINSNSYVFCPEFDIVFNEADGTLQAPDGFLTYEWSYNGLPLDEANGNVIANLGSGNYSVEITTEYGCTSDSEVLTITVGVDDFNRPSLTVYPNPTDGPLNLVVPPGYRWEKWQVYRLDGQIMLEGLVNGWSGPFKIDTSVLSAGSYLVSLSGVDGQSYVRFVKR